MSSAVHIMITGRVQGVGFRWFVARAAHRLGVSGYVRNLYDGSVEIHAEGERQAIDHFISEVRVGPSSAMVETLETDWMQPTQEFSSFEIR